MLEIARYSPEIGVFQKDIAEKQDISVKYLDHIIHALKAAGLIRTVKGKKSGYVLTRHASKISILDIHNAFEPGICVIDCINDAFQCVRKEGCEARGFWGGLNQRIIEYFDSLTLQDLLENKMPIEDAL
jgi:Rrf2 family protein